MRTLASTLLIFFLSINTPLAFGKNLDPAAHHEPVTQASNHLYQIMKKGNLKQFLENVRPHLDHRYYKYLSEKISKIGDKNFSVTRSSPFVFQLNIDKTLVSYKIIDANEAKFLINNRAYKFDPKKSPEVTLQEVIDLLPQSLSSKLFHIVLPRAEASLGFYLPFTAFAVVTMGAMIYLNSKATCYKYDRYLSSCKGYVKDGVLSPSFPDFFFKSYFLANKQHPPAGCRSTVKQLKVCFTKYKKLLAPDQLAQLPHLMKKDSQHSFVGSGSRSK